MAALEGRQNTDPTRVETYFQFPTFSFSRQATKGGKRPCARPRRVATHGRVRLEIRALGERRSTRSTVKVKVYGFAMRGAYRTMILLSYYMP